MRLLHNHGVQLLYDNDLVDLIRQRCIEVESGARTVDQLLANTLLPAISRELLERMIGRNPEAEALREIGIGVGANGEFTYHWSSANVVLAAM